jgi:hypothetical protein
VLECLDHMICQRQQQQQMACSTSAADAPEHAVAGSAVLPALLAGPPPGKHTWWNGHKAQQAPLAGSGAPPSQVNFCACGNQQLCLRHVQDGP